MTSRHHTRTFVTVLLSLLMPGGMLLHAADETIDGGVTVAVPGDHASPWNVDILTVGNTGTGTLNIGAGGVVNSVDGFAGYQAGSNGTVTVSGAGAVWNVTNTETSLGVYGLNLGTYGTGTLTISNGGSVTAASGFTVLGTTEGASGKLTVTGAGSSFTTPGFIYVGRNGAGELEVLNGATLSAQSVQTTGNGGSHVTVSGAGSTLTLDGQALAIRSATGFTSSLTISNGGKFENGVVSIGVVGGADTTAVVTGVGSTIDASAGRSVSVVKGTLDITNGGTVVSASSTSGIATTANSSATVTISGAGSSWTENAATASVGFRVGTQGTGALTLTDGGAFTVKLSNGNLTFLGLATGNNGNGTLNIGNGGIAGVLNATEVRSGTNATANARVNFNHTNDITFSPNITGTRMSVTKSGSGTTILTGANTYTQATAVNAGTLLVNGSLGNTAIAVAHDATFGGTGTVTGSATFADGSFLAPGSSGVGQFTLGGATLAGGASYLWELSDAAGSAGTGWDLLSVTGSLALTATTETPFTLEIVPVGGLLTFDPGLGADFVVASATGGITGFNSAAFAVDASGLDPAYTGTWSASLSGDTNSLIVSYTVPEPSTGVLAVLGAAGLAGWRRRGVKR